MAPETAEDSDTVHIAVICDLEKNFCFVLRVIVLLCRRERRLWLVFGERNGKKNVEKCHSECCRAISNIWKFLSWS